MKKSSLARLRRTLAMIAALTILLATLTACNKAGPDNESTDPVPDSTPPTAATTDPPETTEPPTETTEPEVPTVTATVNTNNLNIRTSPSSTSAILGQLDAGDQIEILEQQTGDGYNWGRIENGWIRLDFVTIAGQEPVTPEDPTTPTETTPEEITGTATNKSGTINTAELNIRSGPDTTYKSVGKYKKGDKVTITETKNGWGKTDKGWIKMSYVDVTGENNNSNDNETDSKYTTLVTNGSKKSLGTLKITAGALNVRYGPGDDYEVIKKVTKDNSYSYYQKSGNWVRISEGWIYTKGYTDLDTASTGTTGTGTVTTGLNIRKEGNAKAELVGSYTEGTKVEILEVKDGWGRTDKGWIALNYVHMDSSSSSGSTGSSGSTASASTGTTTIGLNIRKEGNAKAEVVGGYPVGTKITILEVKDGWGRTDKGWVSMAYVKMDSTTSGSTETTTPTETKVPYDGTITASELRVRADAGTTHDVVGKYVKGDKVTITETKDGWGKTDKGWIKLEYVKAN